MLNKKRSGQLLSRVTAYSSVGEISVSGAASSFLPRSKQALHAVDRIRNQFNQAIRAAVRRHIDRKNARVALADDEERNRLNADASPPPPRTQRRIVTAVAGLEIGTAGTKAKGNLGNRNQCGSIMCDDWRRQ